MALLSKEMLHLGAFSGSVVYDRHSIECRMWSRWCLGALVPMHRAIMRNQACFEDHQTRTDEQASRSSPTEDDDACFPHPPLRRDLLLWFAVGLWRIICVCVRICVCLELFVSFMREGVWVPLFWFMVWSTCLWVGHTCRGLYIQAPDTWQLIGEREREMIYGYPTYSIRNVGAKELPKIAVSIPAP